MKYLRFVILFNLCLCAGAPRISIITSVYNGDEFIDGFLADITRQTIFDQCELIMINANSPGNEEKVIKQYMKQYPNIIYLKLDHDPGLYGVWNMAIKMAASEYITNANLDDRLKPNCYEVHAKYLDENPEIDLVYSGCYKTTIPNETFEQNSHNKVIPHSQFEFNKIDLLKRWIPYPNNHPMWRKSMHSNYGLFNEVYTVAGDMEMWIRAAVFGNAQFKKITGFYGLYYLNPTGLSTAPNTLDHIEKKKIMKNYRRMGKEVFEGVEYLE